MFQGFIKKENRKKIPSELIDNGTIKVVAIGCVALVFSMLVMNFMNFFITKNSIVNKLKTRDLIYMAQSIGTIIDGRIDKAVTGSLLLANDPTMISWVKSNEEDEKLNLDAKAKMGELVINIGFDTSFLTSALNNKYWSFNGQELKLLDTVSKEDAADKWFFDSLNMKKNFEINIDHNTELNDTYVWINALMGDINKPIAVTGVGMRLGDVTEELAMQDSKYGINSDIWLVDEKGTIYLSKDTNYLKKEIASYLPDDLTNKIMQTNIYETSFDTLEYKSIKGEIYDLVYKRIKDTDWKLIVQIPRSESLGFLNAIIYNSLIACIIMILLFVVMFNILANRVANPYKRAMILNQELENKVDERTKELNEKNIRINDSIEYAKMIQETILPSDDEMSKILKNCFVIWKPRDMVGGDFYWTRKFNDGFLIVVGDCTGHGVPGALMTMAANSIINHVVDEICHDDPAVILKEMDRLLSQSFGRSDQNRNIQDGLDAGLIYVHNDNSKIVFAGARISLFIASEKEVIEIKGSSSTIDCAAKKRDKVFINHEIGYEPGMSFYMATDGVKDQPGGKRGLSFGKSRLLKLLKSINRFPMEEQRKIVLSTYEDYIIDETPRDDMTILGFRL